MDRYISGTVEWQMSTQCKFHNGSSRIQTRGLVSLFEYKPTSYRCFGPLESEVKGKVHIRVTHDIKKVLGVRLGLMCILENRCKRNIAVRGKLETPTLMRKSVLFDERVTLEEMATSYDKYFTLKDGGVFLRDFKFSFPVEQIDLPSSCHEFGSTEVGHGNITVKYKLYVRLVYVTRDGVKEEEYPMTVLYQGQSLGYVPGEDVTAKNYWRHAVFEGKAKSLVYDPERDMLVSSKLLTARGPIINRDIYKDLTMFGRLTMNDYVNILEPLANVMSVILGYDVDGLLEPEFCYHGRSTGLGKFELRSVTIANAWDLEMNFGDQRFTESGIQELFKMKLPAREYTMDVKDFKYDSHHGMWKFKLPSAIINNIIPQGMIHYFDGPCMVDSAVEDYFTCRSHAVIIVRLASASQTGGLHKDFKFDTKAMLVVERPAVPPAYNEDHPQPTEPPLYTMTTLDIE